MVKPYWASGLSNSTPSSSQPGGWRPAQLPKPKRNASLRWAMLALMGVLSVAAFGFALQWLPGLQAPLRNIQAQLPSFGTGLPGLQQEQLILVMGVDAPSLEFKNSAKNPFEHVRTDTMMLVRLNPVNKSLAMVSLPRDSKVFLSQDGRLGKLNNAFTEGGGDHARAIVEQSLGVPVHHHLVINFAAVHQLVDAIGGVDVFIEKPLRYTDNSAKLKIDFKPGSHHLNGEQAESFLRFRHDSLGDIGRIRRQQQFLAGVKKQLSGLNGLGRLPQVLKQQNNLFQSSLSPTQLLGVFNFARQVPTPSIRMATLPGHASTREALSYWIVEPLAATQLLNRLVFDSPPEPTAVDSEGKPVYNIALLYPRSKGPVSPSELESLNATLQPKGFKVVCQQAGKVSGAQLLETSYRTSPQATATLQKALPQLAEQSVWFHPNGSTYENLSCASNADYSITLP